MSKGEPHRHNVGKELEEVYRENAVHPIGEVPPPCESLAVVATDYPFAHI